MSERPAWHADWDPLVARIGEDLFTLPEHRGWGSRRGDVVWGADPIEAMKPFAQAFDAFHLRTRSNDWLEGLVTAYVGDGLAADFYTEIGAYLDPQTRQVITENLRDAGNAQFVVPAVRAAIEQDHRVGGRLALWGRRLMGEALTQAQRVAAERDELTALLAGGVDRPGLDLAAIGRLFARLTENHTARMTSLGLDA